MIIQQLGSESVTIARFDGKGQITLEPKVETEVDDETGKYLLGMKIANGESTVDFVEIK